MEKYKGCLAFDGDDTIWHNTYKYHLPTIQCMDILCRLLKTRSIHPLELMKKNDRIDMDGVAKYGFSADRFPNSWIKTYREICSELGIEPKKSIEKKLYETASRFAKPPFPMIKDAKRVLGILRQKGYYLVLLTAGDPKIQKRKIKHNNLEKYFNEIEIVLRDKKHKLKKLAKRFGQNRVWMIGNSKKSDILAALTVPVKSIYIPYFTWDYETAEINQNLYEEYVIEVEDIGKLLKIF